MSRSTLVLVVSAAVALLAVVLCFFVAGMKGVAGFALGLFATAFNNWATWGVIALTGPPPTDEAAVRRRATFTVLAFLLKLPLWVAFVLLARRIGEGALPCFLGGLALVYFATIGWALARR
jgi:hypothetical protein